VGKERATPHAHFQEAAARRPMATNAPHRSAVVCALEEPYPLGPRRLVAVAEMAFLKAFRGPFTPYGFIDDQIAQFTAQQSEPPLSEPMSVAQWATAGPWVRRAQDSLTQGGAVPPQSSQR